jgi:hypothetical protein
MVPLPLVEYVNFLYLDKNLILTEELSRHVPKWSASFIYSNSPTFLYILSGALVKRLA